MSLSRLRYSDGVLCCFVRIELEERSLMKNGQDEPEEREGRGGDHRYSSRLN